jgi:hypothetical protein
MLDLQVWREFDLEKVVSTVCARDRCLHKQNIQPIIFVASLALKNG